MRIRNINKLVCLILSEKAFLFQRNTLFLGKMLQRVHHPNAFLIDFRNIKPGLRVRTKILNILENQSMDAKTIAKETGVSYRSALHHLRLIETGGIVKRIGNRPYIWMITGLGQKRLMNLD